MSKLEELEKRVAAIEAHLAKLPAGVVRFTPGEALGGWDAVTADLNDKQRAALRAAGLHSIKELQEATQDPEGFTKIDGLGAVADAKLRAALKEYENA